MKLPNISVLAAFALTFPAALLPVGAQAQSVDFSGLSGSNGDAFTGPYVEDGFTISAIGGQVFEGHLFGNPQPSLVVGGVFGGGSLGVIQVVSLSSFALGSFDLSAQNGSANYTVDGYLGAANLYSFGASAGAGFSTYGGNGTFIDRLVFTLQPTGSSVNIDNLQFRTSGAVPEPATWAMLLLGFGFVGSAMRSRRRHVVRVSYT
jgi:hypothetical protein